MNATILEGDALEEMRSLPDNSIDGILTDPPYGLNFMGKGWDRGIPGTPYWMEALRVVKPGSSLLAFGGTRTYHRLMVAIEDAGWEIRDCLMWVYGEGMPKSHDISKALDKAAGAVREVAGTRKGTGSKRLCGDDAGKRFGPEVMETLPTTEAAQRFEGYGTGLKPAWEPIIWAMKPYDGTYAQNAATWGVAGLNINAGRVPTPEGLGRWPANLIHDGSDEVIELFPQSAPSKAADRGAGINGATFKAPAYASTVRGHNDEGGSAARFFYAAKASRRERTHGGTLVNNHPTVKPLSLCRYLARLILPPGDNKLILDPFCGSGSTGLAVLLEGGAYIGIDREANYVSLARKRLERLGTT